LFNSDSLDERRDVFFRGPEWGEEVKVQAKKKKGEALIFPTADLGSPIFKCSDLGGGKEA